MFVPAKPAQPLILPTEKHSSLFVGNVSHGKMFYNIPTIILLIRKYKTRIKELAMGKHSSVFAGNICKGKKFYKIVTTTSFVQKNDILQVNLG